MPYGAFKAMYVTRPAFNESGLEALRWKEMMHGVRSREQGWSWKGALPLGANWQLKGVIREYR